MSSQHCLGWCCFIDFGRFLSSCRAAFATLGPPPCYQGRQESCCRFIIFQARRLFSDHSFGVGLQQQCHFGIPPLQRLFLRSAESFLGILRCCFCSPWMLRARAIFSPHFLPFRHCQIPNRHHRYQCKSGPSYYHQYLLIWVFITYFWRWNLLHFRGRLILGVGHPTMNF